MFINAAFPYFSEESLKEIANDIKTVLKSGRLTDGPHAEQFEKEFAKYNNIKHAVAVNSGTGALDVALRYFRLNGKEVIVPTNTFISTPNSVIFAGGRPVFADMDPETLCINVEDVKKKVTPKTAGVMVVHIAGLVCPQINELKNFCQEKGLFLVEDCAHAHGATLNGQKAGSFGDVGCFSFYPTKVMTSCEGGMIVTENSELAEEARCLRTCGQNIDRQAVMLGQNWRLNEVLAVIGRNQLAHLEEFLAKRNQIAKWYQEALAETEKTSFFNVPKNSRHGYYKFPVKLADEIDRIKLSAKLKGKYGIETGHVYYPPCHLQPLYMQNFGTKTGDFPIAERVLKQVLCLPMHYGLTNENVKYVTESLVLAINA